MHPPPPYRCILEQKMTGQVHGVVELWGDWRRRPLLTPKHPKLQNFTPPTWKIHNLWGVGETTSIYLKKIQAKFDMPGLKHLGPAWQGSPLAKRRAQRAGVTIFHAQAWHACRERVWGGLGDLCGYTTPSKFGVPTPKCVGVTHQTLSPYI